MSRWKSIMALAGSICVVTAIVANAAPQSAKAPSPDLIEVRQYPLTMDKIQRLADTYQAIFKLMAADPSLKKESKDAPTIDAKAKEFDKDYPQATALIRQHGFTTREYIVASGALFNDIMVVGMKKQGMLKSYPPGSITAENAAFVEKNYDKLEALAKKMTPPHEGDSDDD